MPQPAQPGGLASGGEGTGAGVQQQPAAPVRRIAAMLKDKGLAILDTAWEPDAEGVDACIVAAEPRPHRGELPRLLLVVIVLTAEIVPADSDWPEKALSPGQREELRSAARRWAADHHAIRYDGFRADLAAIVATGGESGAFTYFPAVIGR